jgi:imidazole glycerol-phosphate synthase subunit HisH
MITIIDYGLGNIRAFLNVYKRLNIEARAVTDAASLRGATKIILPGVGHFDHAMEQLDASGMRPDLDALVHADKVPVLGICVGMQMLASTSDEGTRAGLGWIAGRVRSFENEAATAALPMPHMGWNDVTPVSPDRIFAQLETESRFYFLHSYFFECARTDDVLAVSSYGSDFACAVRHANIYGVQFHPEKSHHFGTRLLQNFAEL